MTHFLLTVGGADGGLALLTRKRFFLGKLAVDLFALHPVNFSLELEFISGREVLDLIVEVVRARKSLAVLRHLTARKESERPEGQNRK